MNEHSRRGGGDLLDGPADALHLGVTADEAGHGRWLRALQAPVCLVQKSCAPRAMVLIAFARSSCPVSTMTFVSGASAWISSSRRSPSVGSSGCGGSPRSIVTT